MPERKRFLFLDDNKERHEHFEKMCEGLPVDVWHAWTAPQAISRLARQEKFDTVFLDHDLDETSGGDGLMVAEFIAYELPSSKRPPRIVVHSWNQPAARKMMAVLKEAGLSNVRYCRFSFDG